MSLDISPKVMVFGKRKLANGNILEFRRSTTYIADFLCIGEYSPDGTYVGGFADSVDPGSAIVITDDYMDEFARKCDKFGLMKMC
jgi:hypothetical protein